jgi:hypothetical protein
VGKFGKLRIGSPSFLEVEVSPEVYRLDYHLFTALAGKEDERDVAISFPGLFKEFYTIYPGHLVV